MRFTPSICSVCGKDMYMYNDIIPICSDCLEKEEKQKICNELEPLKKLTPEQRIERLEEMVYKLNKELKTHGHYFTASYGLK